MNIIHIGLERTGNTVLQNAIFSQHPSFTYVGAWNDLYPNDIVRELITRISSQDSLDYSHIQARGLLEIICARGWHHKPILIASERFSLEGGADRRIVAGRLYDLFFPAKVLIVLRAQTTMVQAQYLKYLSSLTGHVVSFEAWLDRTYGDIEFPEQFRLGLDYEPLIRMYEEIFGFENLVLLPSELMHEENSIYQTQLANLLELPLRTVHEALQQNLTDQRVSRRVTIAHRIQDFLPAGSNLALLGRQWLPQFVYEPIRSFFLAGRRVEAPALSERSCNRIVQICAAGNARLASRTGLPLRELGYPA